MVFEISGLAFLTLLFKVQACSRALTSVQAINAVLWRRFELAVDAAFGGSPPSSTANPLLSLSPGWQGAVKGPLLNAVIPLMVRWWAVKIIPRPWAVVGAPSPQTLHYSCFVSDKPLQRDWRVLKSWHSPWKVTECFLETVLSVQSWGHCGPVHSSSPHHVIEDFIIGFRSTISIQTSSAFSKFLATFFYFLANICSKNLN